MLKISEVLSKNYPGNFLLLTGITFQRESMAAESEIIREKIKKLEKEVGKLRC